MSALPKQQFSQSSNVSDPQKKVFNTSSVSDLKPANKNKRVIAFIIDGAISLVLVNLFKSLILIKFAQLSALNAAIFANFISLIYWVALPPYLGATPGKKILGLRIVLVKGDQKITWQTLLLRESLGKFLSAVPLFLGYFWCSFNKEGRTWHDMLAKTKVVEFR